MGDSNVEEGIGFGNIRIPTPGGKWIRLTGFSHVPGMKKNLISVSSLDGKGYLMTFQGGVCTVQKPGYRGRRNGLWHKHLGHTSMQNLQQLQQFYMVTGMNCSHFNSREICELCYAGKQSGLPLYPSMKKEYNESLKVSSYGSL